MVKENDQLSSYNTPLLDVRPSNLLPHMVLVFLLFGALLLIFGLFMVATERASEGVLFVGAGIAIILSAIVIRPRVELYAKGLEARIKNDKSVLARPIQLRGIASVGGLLLGCGCLLWAWEFEQAVPLIIIGIILLVVGAVKQKLSR
jgi:hypothetical protein